MDFESFMKHTLRRQFSPDEVIPHILTSINQYRTGKDIDLTILRSIVDTYSLVSLYTFEGELSSNTIAYHKASLDNMIDPSDVSDNIIQ